MHLPFVLAYLDPGTGSYVFQLALAGVLGAAYALKELWANLGQHARQLFARDRRRRDR
jgi:hypothetical protein